MRYLLLFCFAFLSLTVSFGQTPSNAKQRLEEEKKEFFTRNIELTRTEAKAFWPVYDDYQNRKDRIVSEKRTLMRYYMENSKNMKEQEISETLDKYIALEQQETELFITFNKKFREILPDEKVLRIYVAEIKFKDYLLKQLRTE
jgi:Spy/CpxP family protein refolding chaperone